MLNEDRIVRCDKTNEATQQNTKEEEKIIKKVTFFVVVCKLTSPSQAPDSTVDKLFGCLAMQLTPSRWPSSELRKGFANTRSSFVAFRALVYSRATSNGCNAGS